MTSIFPIINSAHDCRRNICNWASFARISSGKISFQNEPTMREFIHFPLENWGKSLKIKLTRCGRNSLLSLATDCKESK